MMQDADVFNFTAGPAVLPKPVLEQVRQDIPNWNGLGVSIMEISHRTPPFRHLAQAIEQDFRELLQVPDEYAVLFVPGGGRGQFSMVPMNLLEPPKHAAYAVTGIWGKLAYEEALRFGDQDLVVNTESSHFTDIPDPETWASFADCSYLHTVDNETINGVEFVHPPMSGDVPLVCDMSSNLLSRPFDVTRYGLFYACAQKNMGPAGITVVVIRRDLLDRRPLQHTPCMYLYTNHVKEQSLFNTPPVFPWYVCGLVLKWVKSEGGLGAMDRRAQQRSQLLYQYIDSSDFYHNPVNQAVRSRMNVVFKLADNSLEQTFLQQAEQQGLVGLKGHRYVGGLRASLYNAMPLAGVKALISFMQDFVRRYG